VSAFLRRMRSLAIPSTTLPCWRWRSEPSLSILRRLWRKSRPSTAGKSIIRKLCSPITPNKPVRIASLQPSISIILDRLGRLDSLVACTRYCLAAVPVLRGRPLTIVRDSWSTSVDELLAVRPDLVIASVPYRNESLAAILKAGCPVLALAPTPWLTSSRTFA